MFDIASSSTKDLITFYNQHAEQPVKKFKNRAQAERRVSELMTKLPAAETPAVAPEVIKPEETSDSGQVEPKQVVESEQVVGAQGQAVAGTTEKVRPWKLALAKVQQCLDQGMTTRKAILDVLVKDGIKFNTADAAHYKLCVKGKK